MIKRIFVFSLVLTFLSTGNLFANGGSAAQFLELGGGARYLAMGEAASAVADDANAIYWNPANLSYMTNPSLSVMYGDFVESLNYQSLSFSRPTQRFGGFAASVQTFSAGDIKQTDNTGREAGSFSPRDTAVALGWGRETFKNVSLGLSGKFIRSKIINSASTWAVDLGAGWKKDQVQLGMGVRNLGGRLRFNRESDALPLAYHFGGAYRLSSRPLLLSAEGAFRKNGNFFWGLGSEYGIKFKKSSMAFRGGYTSRLDDVPGFAGLSLGLGWLWNPVQLDYAWIPIGDLDQTHRISMTLVFGTAGAAQKKILPVEFGQIPLKRRTVYLIQTTKNPFFTTPYQKIKMAQAVVPPEPLVFIIQGDKL